MSNAAPPGDAARRRSSNRRLGWSLALVALAIFLLTLFLRR